ncbi:hypothetical protein N7508_008138 [Penicillium antarcticum]|uniref:uncharacterized protein n=1 Tax=Penicillium antarcticum TaxID=416450 RepID=UPI0023A228E4|nr:uncharacterized protein N7508_008138 [Penicillium antarcticum]KAJ5297889.1 hypothetical protein N7508_008138 [Penicillium antarcticum]
MAGNQAFHFDPVEEEERERIRDLSRHVAYYCTVTRSLPTPDAGEEDGLAAPQGDEQPASCELAKDITLTALAQLGVHRFNCNRSFVSIIDGELQHIIAEATASVSLRDKNRHLPNDGIYLGARSLDLVWGVCPHTIRLFTGREPNDIESGNVTANRTRYIIRDFRAEDCFKDRPYVREWPFMRFYAEVPLYSATGYVLGSYCVVDDQPRKVFGDEEIGDLQEVADAIGQHLENVRIAQAHTRAEKLVKGLTSFVKEHADFDPTEVSNNGLLQSSVSAANVSPKAESESGAEPLHFTPPGDIDTPQVDVHSPEQSSTSTIIQNSGQSSSSTVTAEESMFFLPDQSSETDPSSLHSGLSDRPVIVSPGEEKTLGDALKTEEEATPVQNIEKDFSDLSFNEISPVSERLATIYSRASLLLRESMDLDGVVCLDACPTNFAFTPETTEKWDPSRPTPDTGFPIAPLSNPLGLPCVVSQEFDQPSDMLSCALKTPFKGDAGLHHQPIIPKGLLHRLLRAYPQGQILSLEDATLDSEEDYQSCSFTEILESGPESSKTQSITNQLAKRLPGAKCAIFLPLWDWNKFRWLSGILVWTTSSYRALGPEELHYFKVFGDAIISEICRINWGSTEKSKFDFISSVSHELRSPLHGILASAELLHGTSLGSAQEEMVGMIERSGLTLLDTTNHMLDFCKINNLRQTNLLNVAAAEGETVNLISDFDISQLVEEVANIQYTGQKASEHVGAVRERRSSSVDSGSLIDLHFGHQDQMSVVIRIDHSDTWRIRSLAGAWRRIVMNLLGNAMKWTSAGFIEVALSKVKGRSERSPLMHLSITDTGRGIAADFIKHKLFVPFSQEDPLSEGVGLGLSIVHQLVTSLGGHINVRSEVGIGTQAEVYIPVQYLESRPNFNIRPLSSTTTTRTEQVPIDPIHACLIGFNGYPDLKEAPTGILTVEGKRKLSIQSTVASILMNDLHWKISLADTFEKARGEVIVIEEGLLHRAMQENEKLALELSTKSRLHFFIILSGNAPLITDDKMVNLVRISQPFGPLKIHSAVEKVMKWREKQEPSSSPILAPGATPVVLSPEQEREGYFNTRSSSDEKNIVHQTAPATSPSGSTSSTPKPSSKKNLVHVLIVDDNEINVKILATFMRKINCSFDTASNGLIALEKYKSSLYHYDFILMDISMPVMDGLVSTSRIREYEKENNLSPSCIMAITGVASTGFQQQASTVGINKYLIKPTSLRELKLLMNIA